MAEGDFRWSVTNGVVRMIDDNGVEGVCGDRTPTPQEDAEHRQAIHRAALPTEEDVDGYWQRREYDPDWPVVVDRVEEVIAARRADGRITEEEELAIRSNHRVCNEIYDATKSALVNEQLNAPRTNEISRLREALRTEDERTGGRLTGRREQIVQRIASLYEGGR